MLKKAGGIAVALLCLGTIAVAQKNNYDVALGIEAALSHQVSGSGTTLAPTQGHGFLATGRVRLTSRFSLAVNYAKFRNSQIYTVPPNTFRVPTRVSEYSGALVFSFKQTQRFEPFVLGGAGLLRFAPNLNFTYINGFQVPINAVNQNRLGFVYGGGLDYNLLWHLALRVQYRGLFFTAPTLGGPGFFTGSREHVAEPSALLVFKF
jgi:opacity protein-like surface antigen